MKVILLKDVPKVGKKNEIKDVADGFAYNSLLPRKLAQIATVEAVDALKRSQEKAEKEHNQAVEEMKKAINDLKAHNLSIQLPANDQGHLFSKFKIEQLKKLFKEKGINFETKYIVPFEFKETGVHAIKVKSDEVSGSFEIEIKAI